MERRSPRASRTNSSRSWTPRLGALRSEEHTSELQSQSNLVCRLLLENKQLSPHRRRDDSPPGPDFVASAGRGRRVSWSDVLPQSLSPRHRLVEKHLSRPVSPAHSLYS